MARMKKVMTVVEAGRLGGLSRKVKWKPTSEQARMMALARWARKKSRRKGNSGRKAEEGEVR